MAHYAIDTKKLEARRFDGFNVPPEKLIIIGLDTPHEKGAHPLYDERIHLPLGEELVLNIMRYGVQEPILVTKDGDDILVLDGRQRVRAAREANQRLAAEGKVSILVPVVVRKGDDAFLFGVMISTNELRKDDDPFTKAEKVQRFLAMGRDENEAALAFGVSRRTVQNWLALLRLHPEVQSAVKEEKLSFTAAVKLASLPREKQLEALRAPTATAAAPAEAMPVLPEAPTAKEVAARVKAARTGTAPVVVPSKALLQQLERAYANDEIALAPEVIATIRWVLGLIRSKHIDGLPEAIEALKPAKKG